MFVYITWPKVCGHPCHMCTSTALGLFFKKENHDSAVYHDKAVGADWFPQSFMGVIFRCLHTFGHVLYFPVSLQHFTDQISNQWCFVELNIDALFFSRLINSLAPVQNKSVLVVVKVRSRTHLGVMKGPKVNGSQTRVRGDLLGTLMWPWQDPQSDWGKSHPLFFLIWRREFLHWRFLCCVIHKQRHRSLTCDLLDTERFQHRSWGHGERRLLLRLVRTLRKGLFLLKFHRLLHRTSPSASRHHVAINLQSGVDIKVCMWQMRFAWQYVWVCLFSLKWSSSEAQTGRKSESSKK